MAGRKRHVPTPETRGQVEALVAFGIRQEHIAEMLGISIDTLSRRYGSELELGLSKAIAKVANSLFRKAIGDGKDSAASAMFFLKTRAQWRETNVHRHEGKDGGPIQTVDASVLAKMTDEQLAEYNAALSKLEQLVSGAGGGEGGAGAESGGAGAA